LGSNTSQKLESLLSPREYPSRLLAITYPDSMRVRQVKISGEIRLFNKLLDLSYSLSGQLVGIEQIDEHYSRMWYCSYLLGCVDHRNWRMIQLKSIHSFCPTTWAEDDYEP